MSSTTLPSTMQAVVFDQYGVPASKQLRVATLPVPAVDPSSTDVLIRVVACALNPVDFKTIEGKLKALQSQADAAKLPQQTAFDAAGVIVRVGQGVTRFKVGDAVFVRVEHHRQSCAAEFVLTNESVVAHKPASISFDEAASIPLAALTALQALRAGGLKQGQSVLITGGAGGCGSMALQLAKHVFHAARVITTASEGSFALVKSLGADEVVDYHKAHYLSSVRDVDLVFDCVGDAAQTFSVLKSDGGQVVSIIAGFQSSALRAAGMPLSEEVAKSLDDSCQPLIEQAALHHATYQCIWTRPNHEELSELAAWIEAKQLKPVVDKVFVGLQSAPEAFDVLAAGRVKGKLVIHVQDL